MKKNYLFTSESVSEGHPDKVCDSISDTLLDLFLTHDPQARSAVETMATTDRVIICGEARLPETVARTESKHLRHKIAVGIIAEIVLGIINSFQSRRIDFVQLLLGDFRGYGDFARALGDLFERFLIIAAEYLA